MMEYTDEDFIRFEFDGPPVIIQCVNCGAYSQTRENVVHHKGCRPGDMARWTKFFEKMNEEENP